PLDGQSVWADFSKTGGMRPVAGSHPKNPSATRAQPNTPARPSTRIRCSGALLSKALRKSFRSRFLLIHAPFLQTICWHVDWQSFEELNMGTFDPGLALSLRFPGKALRWLFLIA